MFLAALLIAFIAVGGAVLALAHTDFGAKTGISRLAIFFAI